VHHALARERLQQPRGRLHQRPVQQRARAAARGLEVGRGRAMGPSGALADADRGAVRLELAEAACAAQGGLGGGRGGRGGRGGEGPRGAPGGGRGALARKRR